MRNIKPEELICLSPSEQSKTAHAPRTCVCVCVCTSFFKTNILNRNSKGSEGNFVKINLKKKSHVKGYALRGVGLRKQVSRCERQRDPRMDGGTGRQSFHAFSFLFFSYTCRSSS